MVGGSVTLDGTPGRTKSRRWIAVGLFVSLVVNLFLAGLMGGQLLRPGFWEARNAYTKELGMSAARVVQRLTRPLDPADRRIFVDSIKTHGEDLIRLGDQLRQQRRAVLKLLRAENLDRQAVDNAFAEMQQRTRAFEAALESAIVEASAKLPPDARKQLGAD
jgi:uncharacterized membrane protein